MEITGTEQRPGKGVRLHYLDWLRVIAIFAVFLFHSIHVFDMGDWHIKNAEQSLALTILLTLLSMWGMPFFFLISGTGSWFALRRRTAGRYASERFWRLAVPFVVGAILFMPLMMYLEWTHKTQLGTMTVPFLDFVLDRNPGFSPRWFGSLGYHLWYLGFLFSFALITLPLFFWLKGDRGKRLLSWLAQVSEQRGGIFIFLIPLTLVQYLLRPFFPIQHDWADFVFRMSFFVLGYVLFSDARFAAAIRRDRFSLLATGVAGVLALLSLFLLGDPFAWGEEPTIPQFYLVYFLVTVQAFTWSVFMLYIGMRFLDFTSRRLEYAQQAVLPFFVLHQPAIIVVAFFIVQWEVGIPLKAITVIISALILAMGLYEYVIRRVGLLRRLFGMTAA